MEINLRQGDSRERLQEFDTDSLDAVICDPPYDLKSSGKGGFMGKEWDGTGIAFDPKFWGEVYRVLKPGGVVKAFGGTRTFHRMAVALLEAQFERLTFESWVYATGFPKSLNISKSIDKMHGKKRPSHNSPPITEDAKKWDGWGTALKPAHEPVLVAYKPE